MMMERDGENGSRRPATGDLDLSDSDWTRGEYLVSTRRDRVALDVVHRFLASSYWAPGVGYDTVRRSVEHSLPFGVYRAGVMVGFARVITDYATFAYLADVFVLPEHRGRGLGLWLVECVLAHPALQDLRSWGLKTRDAQALYRRLGFVEPPSTVTFMQRPGGGGPDGSRRRSPGGEE
jgi:GNAT superfamily N-acetyltransferase